MLVHTVSAQVHHVNGEGRDGGVVYSELLGRESKGDEVARRELLNRLFPVHLSPFYCPPLSTNLWVLRNKTCNVVLLTVHFVFEMMCMVFYGALRISDIIMVSGVRCIWYLGVYFVYTL